MKGLKVNYDKTFATKYSRDYYRGTSFHYSGQWAAGVHYVADSYNTDFCASHQVLLACKLSHTSDEYNDPAKHFIYDEDQNIIGIKSKYWDIVIAGINIIGETKEWVDERIDGVIEAYKADIEFSARELRTEFTHDIDDAVNGVTRNYRSEISQTAEEIRSTVEAVETSLDGKMEENYSELKQRADSISATVAQNKSDIEGNLEQKYSELKMTADEIATTVSDVKTDLEGNINNKFSEISQRADQISARVEEVNSNLNGDLEEKYSELKMTADEITSTVAANKTELDNTIQENYSQLSQRADSITATVAQNRADLEGNIEQKYSEMVMTTDEISTTVAKNKSDLEGNIESKFSEVSQKADEIAARVEEVSQQSTGELEKKYSELIMTTDAISATVAANKTAVDGSISDLNSNITQTATEIRSEVNQKITDVDGKVEEAKSSISQTADQIMATVEANKTELDGTISANYSELKQTAEEISARVTANKTATDGRIEENYSELKQTAEEIRSEVNAHVETLEGEISDTNSSITQTAAQIRSDVTQQITNTETNITNAYTSAIDQKADSITSSVKETTDALGERITTAETSITQNTQGISLTAEKLNTLETSVGDRFAADAELLRSLQNQVDGAIETYYYDYEPTLQNFPASDWTTDEIKENHIGDLFYNKSTGYSYRFFNDNGTYKWSRITDSDITTALANAAKAQSTADGKMTIFYTQPSTYRKGDLWIMEVAGTGDTGDKKDCIIKKSTEDRNNNYVSSDWVLVSDIANAAKVKAAFNIMADMIDSQVAEYTSDNELVPGSLYSHIVQSRNQISLKIGQAKSEAIDDATEQVSGVKQNLLATGIDITNKKIEMTADNIILKNNSGTRALSIVNGSDGKPVIDTSNLNVSGIFSTSAWNTTKNNVLDTAQGYANTAQSNAEATASADATAKANAAITAAAQDASNKALEALNSAKSYATSDEYLNGHIFNTVDTKITDASGTILADAAADATSKANAAEAAAKADAAAAQSAADTANANATAAQFAADAAQASANTANAALSDWASDSKISPIEKTALKQQLNDINGEKDSIVNDANKYNVSYTDYLSAYDRAKTALEYYIRRSPEVIDIITDTSNQYCYTHIANYYNARTTILNDIATAAKKVATDAQAAAEAAQDTADSASRAAADARALIDERAYLTTALNNDTTIAGGLILSTLIQLGSNTNGTWQVWSGINGGYTGDYTDGSNIAAWFGGAMIDKEKHPDASRSAKSLFRMDGTGYLAGGNISWDTSGNATFNGDVHATTLTLGDNVVIDRSHLDIPEGEDMSAYVTNDSLSTTLQSYALSSSLSAYTTNEALGQTLQNYLTSSAAETTYLKPAGLDGYLAGYIKTNVGIGSDDADSTYFIVDTDGLLIAKNAIITGQINATIGYIGGIAIGNNGIASDNNTFSVDKNGNVIANSITLANGAISSSINTYGFTFGKTNNIAYLYNGKSGLNVSGEGIYIGTDGIALGNSFKVTKEGIITLSYNSLSDKPSIPTDVSQLTDNNGTYITPTSITTLNVTAENLKVKAANIDGTITATNLDAATGTFTGTLSAATGSFSGSITAENGYIGGWAIQPNYLDLYDPDNDWHRLRMGYWEDDRSGHYYVFAAGEDWENSDDFNFAIDDEGHVYASGASISGRIVSSSGQIGGFTIDTSKLYNGLSTLNGTTDGIYLGTDGIALGGGKFKVTKAGYLTTTSGQIAQFVVDSEKLSYGFQHDNHTISYFDLTTNGMIVGLKDAGSDYPIYDFSINTEDSFNSAVCTITRHASAGTALRIDVGQTESTAIEIYDAALYSTYICPDEIYMYNTQSRTMPIDISATSANVITCNVGMFAGLRPKTRYITSSNSSKDRYLDSLDYNIVVNNSSSLILYLPSSPKAGQTYYIMHTTATPLSIHSSSTNIFSMYTNASASDVTFNARGTLLVVWNASQSKWICDILSSY